MSSGSPVVSSICWSWITGLSWICFQEKKNRYILGDDICSVTGELGQEKAIARLTFEKSWLVKKSRKPSPTSATYEEWMEHPQEKPVIYKCGRYGCCVNDLERLLSLMAFLCQSTGLSPMPGRLLNKLSISISNMCPWSNSLSWDARTCTPQVIPCHSDPLQQQCRFDSLEMTNCQLPHMYSL